MGSVVRVVVVVASLLLLLAASGRAQRLMELEGIQLRGSARVVTYAAVTCEIREGFAGDARAYDPTNRGQPLDIWQLDFSVYNGSGKWLDHLIARYNVASEFPPCSSWDGRRAGTVEGFVEAGNAAGFIQETGRNVVEPGQTLTKSTYLVVFHSDEPPRFERWSMDYEFAVSPPAGSSSAEAAQRSETGRQGVPVATEPAGRARSGMFVPGQTCSVENDPPCWLELAHRSGCYTWNVEAPATWSATWNGECSAGLAHGTGRLVWERPVDDRGSRYSIAGEGELRDGRMEGRWTLRSPTTGTLLEGLYLDGKRSGRWTTRGADGDVSEGVYVDGKKSGRWTEREGDGVVSEGAYVDGKKSGRWTTRHVDDSFLGYVEGDVSEGLYVDGKKSGRWTTRHIDGNVSEGLYVDGLRQGHWVVVDSWPDPSFNAVYEGRYVDGERHGRWTYRGSTTGTVWEECYSKGLQVDC